VFERYPQSSFALIHAGAGPTPTADAQRRTGRLREAALRYRIARYPMGLTNPIIPDARAAEEGDVARAGRRHSATSSPMWSYCCNSGNFSPASMRRALAQPDPESRSNARLIAQNDELNDFIAAE
jgi:hypothetical protein